MYLALSYHDTLILTGRVFEQYAIHHHSGNLILEVVLFCTQNYKSTSEVTERVIEERIISVRFWLGYVLQLMLLKQKFGKILHNY